LTTILLILTVEGHFLSIMKKGKAPMPFPLHVPWAEVRST